MAIVSAHERHTRALIDAALDVTGDAWSGPTATLRLEGLLRHFGDQLDALAGDPETPESLRPVAMALAGAASALAGAGQAMRAGRNDEALVYIEASGDWHRDLQKMLGGT